MVNGDRDALRCGAMGDWKMGDPVVIAPVVPEHPAKFSKAILGKLREMLAPERDRVGQLVVLDPFAGAGGIHDLAEANVRTVGYELQPEWAHAHPDTICGSVLELPSVFPASTFDALVTSPCYGNRFADHHQAKDPCKAPNCVDGKVPATIGQPLDGFEACPKCGGTGLTERNTYAHKLRAAGAEPVDSRENAQTMQWGDAYRAFHRQAWSACDRVLRPDGLVLLNVKNHWRGPKLSKVVEFHLNEFLHLGYTFEGSSRIETRGLAQGSNHDRRTGFELILALRKPA